MNTTILLTSFKFILLDISTGYIIGGIIAAFLLAYLFYSLIKPEKF